MVRSVFVGALALLSPALALQTLPIPYSQLKKQVKSASQFNALAVEYPVYNLSVPIDHFHNETKYEPHSDGHFPLRYWFDAQFYKPGGPVFVLSGGETDGADRIPFLEKGIVHEIAKATNGIGVILEHRYYGESLPVSDFNTDSLRFLTTEQALADTAYFAKNVKFEGLNYVDTHPDKTPWIAYGGSYAGSFVAFLRVVYPDVFFAAVSSSGVPQAIWDYWQYFEAARIYGPKTCVETQGKLTNVVDNILLKKENAKYVQQLKDAFGLGGITDNQDFAAAITGGIYTLQSLNWDPEISDDEFFRACDKLSNNKNQYPKLESRRKSVEQLIIAGGYKKELNPLVDRMLNYIGTIQDENAALACEGSDDECFGTFDKAFAAQNDTSQTWRLWNYQVCTEWGFLQTGNTPKNILPMISRAVDLPYSAKLCNDAFGITKPANVSNINKYGGHQIHYNRLAVVDGEWDPWRAAGCQALSQPKRHSKPLEPAILISKAVHHWDENGVTPDQVKPNFPPKPVADAKKKIATFVKEALKEWKKKP